MKLFLPLALLFLSYASSAQTVNVSGRFYYDVNGNHIFDGTDSVLANKPVHAYGANSTYNTSTNASGQYSVLLALGSYDIGITGYMSSPDYQTIYDVQRTYTSAGTDVVDFAYQQRDSIEMINIYIENLSEDIPPAGTSKQYTIYFSYDGLLPHMPATLRLQYNPMLTVQSSTLTPSLNVPGKLEWYFPYIERNLFYGDNFDSVKVTFSIPAVGDTISGFRLRTKLIPGIAVSTPPDNYYYNNIQYVEFPEPPPAGPSSGLKWLRHFQSQGIQPYDECVSIDTTQNSDGYFIAGHRMVEDSGQYHSSAFIAKLNNDGLSVWEQYLDSVGGTALFSNVTTIKHTADGGCVVLGEADDYDSYNSNIMFAKFDAAGALVWKKELLGSGYEYAGYSVELLADGSFVFCGNTRSHDGDFLNNPGDTLHDNIFVAKVSATGSIVFIKVYGGSKGDFAGRVKALQNGTFIVMNSTESNDGNVAGAHQHYAVEPGSTDSSITEEAWVMNLDAAGNIIWSKCFGGTGNSYFFDAADNNGGILFTGYTDSKNGDLPYYPEAYVSLWALQVSNTGNIVWSKLHKLYKGYQDSNFLVLPEAIYDNMPYSSLHKTRDGNFVLAGDYADKYGAIRGRHGDFDFVVIKINNSGDIVWQKSIGGTKSESLYDIQVDKNDDILFVGSSASDNDDLYQHSESEYGYLMVVGKVGITNVIKGQVFVDNNGNHIKDAGEHYYSQGSVSSIKGTDTTMARIFNGRFLNNVDTGHYVTSYRPANNYYTIYPASRNSNFTGLDMTDSFDIALTPLPNINDLHAELLPLSIPRPGFDVTYRVITKNVGTTTMSNVVVGFVKDSKQTYLDASRPEAGMAADSIWWGPFTLNAFDIDTLYINLTNDAPPLLNNGDTLSVRVTANPVLNDSSTTNNTARLREIVQGSFDPNDKAEAHAGTLTTTQYASGEFLQYHIRFQNTGTDTAFFITVKDTLQSRMDLSTMEIVSASHPFSFRLNGNVATWDFKNIKLVDSTSNEPESHGFILFKIKPKTGLAVGDTFSNKAAIYFDYNLPVITNTHRTTIGSNSGICPNGNASFFAGIAGASYQWQVNSGAGFTNLSNTGIYSGVTTAKLTLTAVSTALSGYRYRCLVNGNMYSPENKLRFAVEWTGAISNAWTTAGNWDCNVVPDANTEVLIPSGTVNPLISSNVACFNLILSPGTMVTVAAGRVLTVTGK